MKTLETLKKELLEDGIIDATEVNELRDIVYADGIIDKEEADFLFELNDAVSGKNNAPAWKEFFVQAISDFLLKDEVSPNEIDEDEASWLVGKIGADGKIDDIERALLENLKANAKALPEVLTNIL